MPYSYPMTRFIIFLPCVNIYPLCRIVNTNMLTSARPNTNILLAVDDTVFLSSFDNRRHYLSLSPFLTIVHNHLARELFCPDIVLRRNDREMAFLIFLYPFKLQAKYRSLLQMDNSICHPYSSIDKL